MPGRPSPPLLRHLAHHVRTRRRALGQTRENLALASGLSLRYLARVESGDGNISVLRLQDLAVALGTTPDALLQRPAPEAGRPVALVGVRGAGKSTVGPRLARRLRLPFLEMDTWILEACGLSLDQLFELHGEPYYRRLELETLRKILDRGEPAVIAAAGGVVTEPASWALLRARTTVVWLRADALDHWNRLIEQGDRRPMADHPEAMDELRAMLASRERTYAEAHLTVETSGRAPDDVAREIAERLERSPAAVRE